MARLHRLFKLILVAIGTVLIASIGISIETTLVRDALADKQAVCDFYFGNKAHSLAFISITGRYFPDWKTALAVIETESGFDPYCKSTYTVKVKGKKKKVAFLCRGYFQMDKETFKLICKKYKINFTDYWDIYDSSNNILVGVIHLRDCLSTYGYCKGLEIYNVGSGNFFDKGWRNQDYVKTVQKNRDKVEYWEKEFRRQRTKKTSITSLFRLN